MRVLDGDFPWYTLECEGKIFEAVWDNDVEEWCFCEDEYSNWDLFLATVGIDKSTFFESIAEAVADFERIEEIKEKQAQIERIK